MGNYTSCVFFLPMHSNPNTAKLMDSQGNLISQVKLPVKAAELMLQKPGHVISPVHELRRASRIIALRAEDELLAGELYMLVPLSRVHRRVSESEKGIIESAVAACKKRPAGKKQRGRSAKVLPATAGEELRKEEEEGGLVEVSGGKDTGFAGLRSGNQSPWTPVLESISEEF